MTKICGVHFVARVFTASGLDDVSDFSSLGLFCRANAMPAIDELIALIDLYRGQHVEDIRVLRDQVVAVAKPRVQIVPKHDVVEEDQLWEVHIGIAA